VFLSCVVFPTPAGTYTGAHFDILTLEIVDDTTTPNTFRSESPSLGERLLFVSSHTLSHVGVQMENEFKRLDGTTSRVKIGNTAD
jgi:hypothetical protein